MSIRSLFSLFLLIASTCWTAGPAWAHNAPGSTLQLDARQDGIDAELRMPLGELELALALGQALAAAPAEVLPRLRPVLEAYVLAHLHLTDTAGQPWHADVSDMQVALGEQPVELVTRLRVTPPSGASMREFVLRCDAVGHQVVNHKMLVTLRSDFGTGTLPASPRALDTLRYLHHEAHINLGHASGWMGAKAVFKLGMQHIAEGTDHLMFLLVLLLPAPLLAAGARWGGPKPGAGGAWALAGVVTAFTIGHSLTLLLAALGWVRLPSAPVEVLIALSIVVSAVHALRPCFPGREAWVAAAFGLVHGLAFGDTVAALGLRGADLLWCMAGFNLGVEVMQLLVLVVTLPWLLVLARTAWYRPVRMLLACAALAASLAWLLERGLGWANPLERVIESAARHAPIGIGALALVAVLAWWRQRPSPVVPT